MSWWVGVPAPEHTGDAHLLAALDGALAGTGRRAEWVQTAVDRTGPAARETAAWQLVGADPEADDGALVEGLADALGGPVHRVRTAPEGRVVRFPGGDTVPHTTTVAHLLSGTGIDRVVGIGSPAGAVDVVDTLDGFLRPTRTPAGVDLLLDPTGPGTWRPVEISSPHECGGH